MALTVDQPQSLPVLVVGLGPAGAAVSCFLAGMGTPVVAVDRGPQPGPKIGESLPPDAQTLLQQLGVWDTFRAAGHLPCFANKSFWYSQTPQYHDFVQHAVGNGWHIDRERFDAMLRARAAQLGAALHPNTTIVSMDKHDSHWRVTFSNKGRQGSRSFAFVIDATGRNAWVATRLGIQRRYEARQLALTAFLQTRPDFEDGTTLVETTSEGWWYSAKIPGNRMVAAFFHQGTPVSRGPGDWWDLVGRAPQTAKRLQAAEAQLLEKPKMVAADSGILARLHGPGWLAVGDAAMTYDPIASHGLTMAMVSARDGAAAIRDWLAGDFSTLEHYGQRLQTAYEAYGAMRRGLVETAQGSI